jgi:NACalpha-BTF3-like transcription factor|tara:strand:- start:5696 stop:6403 length:708 start_codon:yes stop_codon:yes gene_type:complete
MENSQKTPEYYAKKDFMRNVGLKSRHVFSFLQDKLTDSEIQNLNLIQTFRKYLEIYSDIELKESWNIDEEIENYRSLGFTKESAEQYVKRLKNIFTKDSTINWIFRIAESKTSDDADKNFEKYLKQFDDYNNNNNNNDNNSKKKKRNHVCTSTPMNKSYIIFSDPFGIPPRHLSDWGREISGYSNNSNNSNNSNVYSEDDIRMVMQQANVSRQRAIKYLKKNKGDVIKTIMDLTN